jgi:hypothetical protein
MRLSEGYFIPTLAQMVFHNCSKLMVENHTFVFPDQSVIGHISSFPNEANVTVGEALPKEG